MDNLRTREDFFRFVATCPLLESASRLVSGQNLSTEYGAVPFSIRALESLARGQLGEAAYQYAAGGADDELTLAANREAFTGIQIRCRRLIDVSRVETGLKLLGQEFAYPIALAPVGFQGVFCDEAECASARGAAAAEALMICSSVSTKSIGEIAAAGKQPVWFQLYPTDDRGLTRELLARAEAAGCPTVALTVDTPCFGNRERHGDFLAKMLAGAAPMANYKGLSKDLSKGQPIIDPSMTWEMVAWLRANTTMKIVLKGIVTHEDANRSVECGVDAVIVSNHGGRQEESLRSAIDCLPEVAETIEGRIPILIDGGFRRGSDVYKALALGASMVCIGRPYIWGLAAFGDAGVTLALEVLRTELIRCMQLAGTPSLGTITPNCVQRTRFAP